MNAARISRALLVGISITLIGNSAAYAEPVSEATTRTIVESFIAHEESARGFTVQSSEDLVADGRVLATVHHLRPMGFVIVARHFGVSPIKSYSFESTFVNSPGSPLFDLLAEDISYGIADDQGQDYTIQNSPMRGLWDAYLSGNFPVRSRGIDDFREGDTLLTSLWRQGSSTGEYPYNWLVPGYMPAGCVAVAMGQTMNFWKWPHHGSGSHSYNWNGLIPLFADFSDEYDWNNMLDQYSPGAFTVNEGNAVAELLYECGVSVEMDYDPDGSGAETSDAKDALQSNFKYENEILQRWRYSYSASSWFYLLRRDLQLGCPMIYRYPGHSLVCDGWKWGPAGEKMFHYNLGWGSGYNAWYAIDEIVYDQSYNHYVLRRIAPKAMFPRPEEFLRGAGRGQVATGYINADGLCDVVGVTPDGLQVLWGSGGKWFDRYDLDNLWNGITPDVTSIAIVDFDGDGDGDIFVTTPQGSALLVNSAGTFQVSSQLAGYAGHRSVWHDLDGSGYSDLILSTGSGVDVFLNNGAVFTRVNAPGIGWAADDLCVSDLDGDMIPEICIVNAAAAWGVRVYESNGDGTFSDRTNGAMLTTGSTASHVLVDRLVSDSTSDVFIYNDSGDNWLFDVGGGFSAVLHSNPVSLTEYPTVTIIDHNYDGYKDLVFLDGNGNFAVFNGSVGGFSGDPVATHSLNSRGPQYGFGLAVGDLDWDRDESNWDYQNSSLPGDDLIADRYFSTGDDGHDRMKCYIEQVSTADPFGATLFVTIGGRQIREYVSMNGVSRTAGVIDVGFGTFAGTVTAQCIYASGAESGFFHIPGAGSATKRFEEPGEWVGVQDSVDTKWLLVAHPNPFNACVEFSITNIDARECWIEIFDIRGRRLASRSMHSSGDGRAVFSWDGTSDDGRVCASGNYTALVRAKSGLLGRASVALVK